MAGITTSFPFNPLLTQLTTATKTTQFILSSLESKLFGLRFHCSKPDSLISLSRASVVTSARFGGGFRSSGDRRSRQSDSEDDHALDISTIRSATVRLIDEQQNMVGVVPKSEAIQMAENAALDLVILSPDADPPVVRIMDYNKYRYELQKKKKGQQKKSAATRMDLKELKMGYNIDQHDYDVRLRAARKFLKDGDKVKVIVNLKGRENEFRNIAIELIRRFQNDVGELATEETKNFRDRNIFITLAPNKAILQKSQEPPKKRDKSAVNEVSAGV
ncbi:translation initiation factor IF3-4, chloroplastic [Ricinus communis]|uniref:Translation initiation factor IF-3 n=1 Tax=Ricinus communis TaxID=3988 RepID=B9T4Q8_RICCO|nr:translation initiation factor IF3-4, chloroplastic [Ricinus communis]EEF29148.1 translation initiation factor if-3, putative [Ricinus communis]|eukprot:XP_002533227.1 translation initiation factor IF3-4, chloroplastic [Ricinus communis]